MGERFPATDFDSFGPIRRNALRLLRPTRAERMRTPFILCCTATSVDTESNLLSEFFFSLQILTTCSARDKNHETLVVPHR
jgi:hypothetical protein